MPGTYLLPSYAKAMYVSRMHERHGGSHLGWQEYTLNLPFTDPRLSRIGDWWLSIQGNACVTLMDVGGNLDLRKNELLDFSVPVTFIHPLARQGQRFSFTAMPRYAGDAAHSARSWDLALVADYTERYSDTFTYSIGLASSPRFADYAVVPYIAFNWQVSPEWQVNLRGFKLTALYKVSERFQIGPALSNEGGTWMVDTPAGERVFRVRSLTAALHAEYDFSSAGQTKRIITAAIGTTLATSAEICRRNAGHDSVEGFHYKPGLVISAGVDFRF